MEIQAIPVPPFALDSWETACTDELQQVIVDACKRYDDLSDEEKEHVRGKVFSILKKEQEMVVEPLEEFAARQVEELETFFIFDDEAAKRFLQIESHLPSISCPGQS